MAKSFTISDDFTYISKITREDIAKKHSEICDGIKDLYARKNHDYGTVFEDTMHDYGLLAPVVRLRDKLGRIETLLTVKNKVADESIKDTIHDLANYSIMTYAVLSCIEDAIEKEKTCYNKVSDVNDDEDAGCDPYYQ